MTNKKNLKRTGILTGTFLAVAVSGFASTPNTTNSSSSLLDFDVLGTGTEIMADISSLNGNMYRTLELKCGEGKCGEGKCGAETKEKTEAAKKEVTAKKDATVKSAKAKKKASKKAKKVKKTKVGK
jgi:hypothetical protein